jgi:hypothetical protein
MIHLLLQVDDDVEVVVRSVRIPYLIDIVRSIPYSVLPATLVSDNNVDLDNVFTDHLAPRIN